MGIVDIQEATASIASDLRNAYIDFSKMDVSVVKITTDVMRGGEPVVGYGFNSNGPVPLRRALPRPSTKQLFKRTLHSSSR